MNALLALVAAVAVWVPGHMTRTHGDLTATFSYEKRHGQFTEYRRNALEVRRGGRVVVRGPICTEADSRCTPVALTLRDVWGSPEPEVVVDMYTGGAHCCEVSAIVVGDKLLERDWGNYGYHGQSHGGRYYFVTADDRFGYRYTSWADSVLPVSVWTLDGAGRLVDVTRQRLDLVRADAARVFGYYRREKGRDVRGVLAAWCADEYRLGGGRRCRQELARAPVGRAYVARMTKDLVEWGYAR